MLKTLGLLLFCTGLQAAPFDKGGVLGVGARVAGQGGAMVARIDDSESLWWNPAGLDKGRDFDLGLHYGEVLGGLAFDTAVDHSGWLELLDLGYGVGYRHLGFRAGNDEEEFGLGVAFPFTDDRRLLTGLSLRALQSQLGSSGVSARGYGVDLGLSYHPSFLGDALTLGLALRDVQAGLEWSSGVSANPVQLFQMGAAWAFDSDTSAELDAELASDPSQGNPTGEGFKIGAERWWSLPRYGLQRVGALRLGYTQSSALAPAALGGQFSLGLGLQARGASLDYAVVQGVSGFGATQRLSGSYRFGGAHRPTLTPSPTAVPAIVATPAPLVQAWSMTLSAEPLIFNPLNHGAQFNLSLVAAGPISQVAVSRLEILPALGPAIYVQNQPKLPLLWHWDGRQESSTWAPVGPYRAEIHGLDAQGTTLTSAVARFQLDLGGGALRLLPESDVFAPIPQSVRPNAVMAVASEGTESRRWTLTIAREGAARPVRLLSGRKLPAHLVWDGHDRQNRKVPDGSYRLNLSVMTAAGSTLTADTTLDVDTRRPNLELEAQPRVFEPKVEVGSVTFTLGLSGEAGIPARWSLTVETLEGRKLKSFAGKGSPPSQLVWNGVDENGKAVAQGALYYVNYVVEMESGALARQPRMALASKPEEPKQPFRVPLQSVRFAEGEEVIGLDDYRSLKEAAAAVKKYSTDFIVVVTGYAAPGEAGKAGLGELELSFLRAKAVRDFLVDGEGLPSSKVRAAGNGAEGGTPANAGATPEEARAKARRVDVILYAQ